MSILILYPLVLYRVTKVTVIKTIIQIFLKQTQYFTYAVLY